jgi:hypothetical protein
MIILPRWLRLALFIAWSAGAKGDDTAASFRAIIY